jgi:hypothetical protein
MTGGYQMIVLEKVLQQDMYYKDTLILRYTIKYPKFVSTAFHTLAHKLNALYRTKAVTYQKTSVMKLYQMAMVDYEHSVANNFPIHQYEAYVAYTVSYNQNCALSIYFDQYEYTGGAHGLTVRTSDTWDLSKSRRMELSDFFPDRSEVKEFLISNINQQITEQISSGNTMFFDDYRKLTENTFKMNNFYLVEEGLVIYFQQYDIAPYSSGLPTFLIPYGPGGAVTPRC